MDEYVQQIEQQAAATLRRLTNQESVTGGSPTVELITQLLADQAGGVKAPATTPVTTDDWLLWNQLALERPTELQEVVTSMLARERVVLPSDEEALRRWAACLLLAVLDDWPVT